MKFALFSHVPWPEGTDPRRIFEETMDEFRHAEELGFHSAWLAEHHFSRYGLGSSSLVLASSIAAHTKRIRLGTAVLLPTLRHQVQLAEDTATVDSISGGRLDVGFGRGSQQPPRSRPTARSGPRHMGNPGLSGHTYLAQATGCV